MECLSFDVNVTPEITYLESNVLIEVIIVKITTTTTTLDSMSAKIT